MPSVKNGISSPSIPVPSKVLSNKAGYWLFSRFLREETRDLYGLLPQLKGSERVAIGAAHALGSLKDVRSYRPLVEALRMDERPAVKVVALEALAGVAQSPVLAKAVEAQVIEAALYAEDAGVRKRAVRILGEFKSEEAVKALLNAFTARAGTPLEKTYAVESIEKIAERLQAYKAPGSLGGDSEEKKVLALLENSVFPELLKVLKNEELDVATRRFAANALIAVGKPLQENEELALAYVLTQGVDRRVKDGMVAVFAALGGNLAREALEGIAPVDDSVKWAIAQISSRLGENGKCAAGC